MNPKCIFCFSRAFEKLLFQHVKDPGKQQQLAKRFFGYVSQIPDDQPAPVIAREFHAMIRESLGVEDPYEEQKKQSNRLALELVPELKRKIVSASDPSDRALRYAIAGNIIDYGPGHSFDIQETLWQLEKASFAIDHSQALLSGIEKANHILYLGDNAGEIVFDKLFLEQVGHPNVTYAVRGNPVINDVTEKEAYEVGIDQVATVVSNEYDAPSTVLPRTGKAFRKAFEDADLIISKGQGNFEGLMHEGDPRIWFLLMIKCQVIGDYLDVKKGDIVVANHSNHH